MRVKRKTIMGASAAGGSSRDYAFMHQKLNGASSRSSPATRAAADILLALERGEIDGTCGFDWSSLKTQRPDWLRDKKVHILVQVALEPEATLTRMGVPRITGFTKSEQDRKAMELIIGQQAFSRPYYPAARHPAGAGQADPRRLHEDDERIVNFRADAERSRLDIDPIGGEKVQTLVEGLYSAPAEVVEKAKAAVKP